MLRDIDLTEISDGKLYSNNDMVKADCGGCKGCSDCCHGMGNSVVLDPLDMHRLCTGLGKTFEEFMTDSIELNVVDGMENQNGNTRAILDFLTQDKIATLQAENQSLKLAASQQAQNAFITANQEAQTAELIRRLGRDCPVPAFVVPNPNGCYGTPVGVLNNGCGYNNGCGC